MAKQAKKGPSLLPPKGRAPKKTGQRGIGPALDESKDFENPTTAPGSQAEAALAAQAPVEKGSSLLVEQPKKPKVVNGRFEAFYLKPSFGKTPKGDLTLGLRMTLPLEKEHEEILPDIILNGYKDVRKKGRAGERFRDVPTQRVRFFLDDKKKESVLELKAAQILQAKIDVVQRKGEGESRKVIRLSFVLQVKHSRAIASFADFNYGNHFWLELEEVQQDLLDIDVED